MAVLEGRAAVASAINGHTATTERGPPDRPRTCTQNAHKLRHKGLIIAHPCKAHPASVEHVNRSPTSIRRSHHCV